MHVHLLGVFIEAHDLYAKSNRILLSKKNQIGYVANTQLDYPFNILYEKDTQPLPTQ